MSQEKKKPTFNIIKNNPTDGHKGYGIGALSLENVSPVFVDVEEKRAFVDIGVHQDGLVHISEISDRFVRHPSELLSVGDVVNVVVLEVNEQKKRISLSIRQAGKQEKTAKKQP